MAYAFLCSMNLAYGVFVCGFSVPSETKVLGLYKCPITFGRSGFPRGCHGDFFATMKFRTFKNIRSCASSQTREQ